MGFRRRKVIMYRTRQQFPSFMGVYIPPCSNVESSVNICISNVTTVCTTEVLAVPNANVTAFMASLRSICRRDGDNLNAIHLALVFKERTELIEVPGITSPTERLAASLGVHTPSDILQVLNGNALVFFLCFRHDLFTYAGFNSTLVQLKEIRKTAEKKYKESFNSTLVQLKEGNARQRVSDQFEFQFYLSSIKSGFAQLYEFLLVY